MDFDWVEPKDVRPLRRAEYDRMIDLGMFTGENIELLHGILVACEPQGPEHIDLTSDIHRLLLLALDGRAKVRSHSGLATSDDSEPEPDVSVVAPGNYRDRKAEAAFLVVEVSNSSLRRDRSVKADLYAAANVPEYWVVNLVDRVLEIRDRPENGTYRRLVTLRSGERVTLVAFPDVTFDVDQILPPQS